MCELLRLLRCRGRSLGKLTGIVKNGGSGCSGFAYGSQRRLFQIVAGIGNLIGIGQILFIHSLVLLQLIGLEAQLLCVCSLMDLDHGFHVQDQIQTAHIEIAAVGVIAIADQRRDQVYRLAADIVVQHAVDLDQIQAVVIAVLVQMQIVTLVVLDVGILSIDGVFIQSNGNILQFAAAIIQCRVEGDHGVLVGIGIGTVNLAVLLAGSAKLVVLIVLHHFVFNIFAIGVGVVDAEFVGICICGCLIIVDTDHIVLTRDITVAGYVALLIYSLVLDIGSIVSDVQVVEGHVFLCIVAPVRSTVRLKQGRISGFILQRCIEGIHFCIVFPDGFIVLILDVRIENIHCIVVVFNSLQISSILCRTQSSGTVFLFQLFQSSGDLCQLFVVSSQGIQRGVSLFKQGIHALVDGAQRFQIFCHANIDVVFQFLVGSIHLVIVILHLLVILVDFLQDGIFSVCLVDLFLVFRQIASIVSIQGVQICSIGCIIGDLIGQIGLVLGIAGLVLCQQGVVVFQSCQVLSSILVLQICLVFFTAGIIGSQGIVVACNSSPVSRMRCVIDHLLCMVCRSGLFAGTALCQRSFICFQRCLVIRTRCFIGSLLLLILSISCSVLLLLALICSILCCSFTMQSLRLVKRCHFLLELQLRRNIILFCSGIVGIDPLIVRFYIAQVGIDLCIVFLHGLIIGFYRFFIGVSVLIIPVGRFVVVLNCFIIIIDLAVVLTNILFVVLERGVIVFDRVIIVIHLVIIVIDLVVVILYRLVVIFCLFLVIRYIFIVVTD